jgi:YHS domain-containing protein
MFFPHDSHHTLPRIPSRRHALASVGLIAFLVACTPAPDAPGPNPEAPAAEAAEAPSAEAATLPTSLPTAEPTPAAEDHAGHDHAGHDHAGHDHAGHDHAGHDHGGDAPIDHNQDEMENVLEEGEYNPDDLVAQPGAEVGDITRCPVSGEVFLVTEDTTFLDHEGQDVFFCCSSCIRRFQRDPVRYLEGQAADAAPAGPMVEVLAEGSRYAPPVEKAQIPEGAWICDMGTVHYASLSEGTCPLCNMRLTPR